MKEENDPTQHYRCMNQLFRPTHSTKRDGKGDCTVCTYDPKKNEECTHYNPITINIITYKP